MSKIITAILFGGNSSEYEVSLKSSSAVLRNIPRDKYDVVMIGITRDGRWYKYDGEIDNIENNTWEDEKYITPAIISPSSDTHGIVIIEDGITKTQRIDVVFPVLHGKNGEDGTIQGLLSLAGIPFVGCDHISSANCMDKELTHIVLDTHSIKTAKYLAVKEDDIKDFDNLEIELSETLSYPMFVKPANAGSSVGVSKAKNKDELFNAFKEAFLHDKKVVVEQAIIGKEIECAVLGNDDPKASILGEIAPTAEFYSFDAKYNDESTGLHIPARIDEDIALKVQKTAVRAYKALGCSGFTRVDFFVTDNKQIILNEPNTIPGFTSISMYPKLWENSGTPFPVLIDKLLAFAMERK